MISFLNYTIHSNKYTLKLFFQFLKPSFQNSVDPDQLASNEAS